MYSLGLPNDTAPLAANFGALCKRHSGNPLGRPPQKFREREILLLIAKFLETLAKAYCNQSRSVEKIRQIKDILS